MKNQREIKERTKKGIKSIHGWNEKARKTGKKWMDQDGTLKAARTVVPF